MEVKLRIGPPGKGLVSMELKLRIGPGERTWTNGSETEDRAGGKGLYQWK